MRINYQSTVIDSLFLNMQKNPEKNIISIRNINKSMQSFTYNEIYQSASQIAGLLIELALSKGGRVMTILPTGISFINAFFGIQLAGGIPVAIAPVNIGAQQIDYYLNRVRNIIRHSGCTIVLCETSAFKLPAFSKLKEELDDSCKFAFIDQIKGDALYASRLYRPKKDDLCFIQYTSGSTGGSAKGVMISQANLSANIEAISANSKVNGDDSVLSWLPLYHDMGLVGGLLFPFFNEIRLMLLPPELFIFRPAYWLKEITEGKFTFSPANNFAFQYCVKKVRDTELEGLDLSSWRVAHNGSEPIHIKTLDDFYQKFSPFGFRRETILPCYGLAEGTLAVTLSDPDEAPSYYYFDKDSLYKNNKAVKSDFSDTKSIGLVALGKSGLNIEIRIIDEQNKELESNQLGEIAIRGGSVTQGYFLEKSHDIEYFHKGWFKTGDIGFIYDDQLFITGRKKDLIIIRGKNYSPVDIETCLIDKSEGEIEHCVAFGFSDDQKNQESLALVIERKDSKSSQNRALEKKVQSIVAHYFGFEAERIIFQRKIPRTLNGKVKRSQCRLDFTLKNYQTNKE